MKNITCFVLLSPLVGLGLLALTSTLGFSFPFALVAAHLLGFTCAAGALVMFLKDYAPRPRRLINLAPVTTAAESVKAPAFRTVPPARPAVRPTTPRPQPGVRPALPSLGFTNDPATLSLS